MPLARVATVRDSLGRLLAAQPRPDTQRVGRLNALAFLLRTNEAPQAERLARQALGLARQLAFDKGLTEAYFNLGYLLRTRTQYDSAIYYSRQSLAASVRTGNRYTQTRAYYNLARIYTEQGNYAAALGPSLDGLALAHTIRNARAELFQLIQAGRIELALGENAAALAHVLAAQRLVPAAHDPLGTGYVYTALGDISRRQGQWLAARHYYGQTIENYRQVYNARGLLPTELSQAEMTNRLGDHLAARRVAYGLLRRAQATGTPEQVAQATLLVAQTWLATTRPDSARHYAARSLATARPAHLRPVARDAALVLAQASDQLGQGHAAYRYQALAGAYADSITGENTQRRVAALEAQGARSQQQAQIKLLRQRASLQQQRQELELLRHRGQVAGLVGLATLGIGGLLWYYRRRLASREAALRQRLAADLHDEVGNLLTQVSLQADLLRETSAGSADQMLARLQRLSDTSRRARREMTDVVWGLQNSVLTLPELLTRMRDHAHQVLPSAGLAVDFAVAPEAMARHPSPLCCQHLYLIYKEALHNVVKHARHATQVTVRVFSEGPGLGLSVQDDGPAAGSPAPERAEGNGLRNMRRRAEALGGTLHAASGSEGFKLLVYLPIP